MSDSRNRCARAVIAALGLMLTTSVLAAPADLVRDYETAASAASPAFAALSVRQPGTGESGSGLGLSIVRRIAELHDAHVAFAPNLQGRGLAVTVRFHPAASQAAKSSTAK
jgi:hypothetical protein